MAGGPNHSDGRVEMFLARVWGTIGDYQADGEDAKVVCRQLGFQINCEFNTAYTLGVK